MMTTISYWDEIKARVGKILLTLLDLLTSKKFLVAVAGGYGTYQATGDAWAILWAALAYIVAQAAADFGKESALVNAIVATTKTGESAKKNESLLPTSPVSPLAGFFPIAIQTILMDAGYTTIDQLRQAGDIELLKVVSPSVLQKIRELIQ